MKAFRFLLPAAAGIIPFLLYGFTLTTCTVFCICCILSVAFLIKGIDENYGSQIVSLKSYILLLLVGTVSLVTLYKLYNPSKEVFTNADHHILTFEGFHAETNKALLFGDPYQNPIWSNEELGGKVEMILQEDSSLVLSYESLLQPLYMQIPQTAGGFKKFLNKITGNKTDNEKYHEELVNKDHLPAFDKTFTLTLRNNLGISVTIDDVHRPDRPLEFIENKITPQRSDSCVVKVQFLQDNQKIGDSIQGGYTKLIRRSLALSDIINDIPIPEGADFDWSLLNGITVLREKPAKKDEYVDLDKFHLAFTPQALDSLKLLEAGGETYTRERLLSEAKGKDTIIYKNRGLAIHVGSGMETTPAVFYGVEDDKLFVKMNAPQRQYLPMDREVIDQPQTFVITSSLIGLASSETTSALHYPILRNFGEQEQIKLAVEYLPEHTSVPLTCKIQSLGRDQLNILQDGIIAGTNRIAAGNRLILSNKSRNLSPVFTFENLRDSKNVPFTSQHGYWLILTALICAGISFVAGRDRFETRGEVIVWMGLIALLTYRAFIAWRTSVFPPMDNFSISRWNIYQNTEYTFGLTFYCIIALSICWSLYKLFHHKKELCYQWLEDRSAWILPIVTLGVIVCGFGAGIIISERLSYVFFPVFSFIAMEWIFQHKRHEEEIDFRWHCMRYISMLISLAVPLVTDAGFGIVFALFLFLYNALENFYQAQTEFHETGVGMNKYTILMFIFLLLFSGLLFGGIHVLSFLFAQFYVFAAGFVGVMALLAFLYYRKAKQVCEEEEFNKGWIYAPLIGIALVSLLFVSFGKDYLDGHKHLLYRAEVHLKDVDEIMLENEVESRDLVRLFQASQNRWYLGYYMDERGWEKAVPFDYKPYDLRSHFNKGITWDTQKTDAVLGRYVIGEHSLMTVYSLIALFFAIFVGIFVINRRREQFRLLGTGVTLLLACQAIFITLAVTNRFIFFGQDYPLVSQHSMLTLALTFTALLVIGLSSQREEFADDINHSDARTSTILVSGLIGLFALSWIFNYILPTKGGEDFNVAAALREADEELEKVNEKLIKFQDEYREEIAKKKMLANFKTQEEIKAEEKAKKGKKNTFKPKQIQTNYHEFINFFNEKNQNIVKQMKIDSAEATKKDSFSLFTKSLYQTYVKKLAKNNSSTDIIHLRTVNKQGNEKNGIKSGTYVKFNTNGGFYRLTTPETTEKSWRGNIIPQGQMAKRSNLSIQQNGKNITANQPQNSGKIIDREDLYLAKVDPNWTVGNKNYYIIGAVKEYATIKSGTDEYELKASKDSPQCYMNVQTDDYIKVGDINISNKGDEGRYFARNLLVNGKRTMIYPLGKKFFYPYHLAQLASDTAALSGEDVVIRNKDIQLTLSYTLTDSLFNILRSYSKFARDAKARSLIVADGNGHIKAMVTTKNERYHSGFEYIDPNDEMGIAKKANQFYLNGDYIAEERTFGDLNFARLNLGPGSSMKPLTFTSVMSQAYYDWSKLKMYINESEQKFKKNGSNIEFIDGKGCYASLKPSPIKKSLYGDEIGVNGYTDIALYMKKSSNFYNSLMVFMGFYQSDYLTEALRKGDGSDLFERYERATNKFPAFTLGNQKYVFEKWVGNDGMDNHQGGALQIGFKENFGLWPADPVKTQKDSDRKQRLKSLNIYDKELFYYDSTFVSEMKNKSEFYSRHSFAFPRFSFLPENMRIGTKQNYKDALNGTTLGGNLFQVTPLKMAEMYGKLFSQNRAYSLTLNPNYVQNYEPFVRAKEYERGGVYENILSNHLFKGMSQVTEPGGTAGLGYTKDGKPVHKLTPFMNKLRAAGYQVYAKTGTISLANTEESQLLGVVITKGKLDGLEKKEFNKATKKLRFYVMYFLTEEYYHNWTKIKDALETIYNSSEFQQYMNGKDNIRNH